MPIHAVLSMGLLLLLGGCVTNVAQKTAVVMPQQLADQPAAVNEGSVLTWGGQVVTLRNMSDTTLLEILAYPLQESGEPLTGYAAQGRFIAERQGFLEPRQYKAGSRVTVEGTFSGFRDGRVDEADYRYPVLQARQLTLWPQPLANTNRPRVHFGIGVGTHGGSGIGIGVGP